MTTLEVGYEVDVVDEQQPVVAPTATDTVFHVHSAAEAEPAFAKITRPQDARDLFPATAAIQDDADAFFNEGGARMYVSKLTPGTVQDALDRFGADLGPGQITAPEVVTGPELVTISEWGWAKNRIYLPNGPAGATDAALETLADAVIAGDGGRYAEMEADTLTIPGTASGQTRSVSAAIVKAALIARLDIATGNPNVAAAGIQNARCRYVIGIEDERTDDERQALAARQVNTFKNVYGQAISSYGYFTLADLDALPHWWDLSGSRTIMAIRAREAAVAEQYMFGQIDGEGQYLAKYEGGLRGVLADLQRQGAIFGNQTSPGYRVDVSQAVNPLANLALGNVTAQITVKTSPFARALTINIIRRPITAEV